MWICSPISCASSHPYIETRLEIWWMDLAQTAVWCYQTAARQPCPTDDLGIRCISSARTLHHQAREGWKLLACCPEVVLYPSQVRVIS